MSKITFSSLPTEIQVSIAKECETRDLANLCLTSKWVNERCLRALYCHVDLRVDRSPMYKIPQRETRKHRLFVRTLLSRSEYGKYVRSLVGILRIPSLDALSHIGKDTFSDEDFWCAMRSLTHIQGIEVGSRDHYAFCTTVLTKQFPTDWFQSVTSVKLMGSMQYGLAKSILNAINPATLKHLCLDLVQDHRIDIFHRDYEPGGKGEDGQLLAVGAASGLLSTLTGRCTALRTLILRRTGQIRDDSRRIWHTPAEEAGYIEWTSFIRSVQGTLENFVFDQASGMLCDPEPNDGTRPFRIMDERFQRLVLPTIISGKWPCLTAIELGGVRSLNDRGRMSGVEKELRLVLGGNVKILVKWKSPLEKTYRWR